MQARNSSCTLKCIVQLDGGVYGAWMYTQETWLTGVLIVPYFTCIDFFQWHLYGKVKCNQK